MDVTHGMGTTSVEFHSDELRCVGGDYGQVILEGTTEAARITINEIVGASRLRSNRKLFRFGVTLDDGPTPQFEDRHAGLEGTPQFDHVDRDSDDDPDGSSGEEGMVEKATGRGKPPRRKR
jgi:hypothetical protein